MTSNTKFDDITIVQHGLILKRGNESSYKENSDFCPRQNLY